MTHPIDPRVAKQITPRQALLAYRKYERSEQLMLNAETRAGRYMTDTHSWHAHMERARKHRSNMLANLDIVEAFLKQEAGD